MPANAEEVPRQLVLDAGPLIALLHTQDPDHREAVRGFTTCADRRTQLVTPLPVVFEVYKWLLYQGGYRVAQEGLDEIRKAVTVVSPVVGDLDAVSSVTRMLQGWRGTLEEATVVLTALRLRSPVWTLNYRDFSAFPRLAFWNP